MSEENVGERSNEEKLASYNFEFKQKASEINLDQTKYFAISKNIDQFRDLVFENFDSDGRAQIQSALLQMLDLHKDQKDRPDGMPYISHPLEVSRTVVQDFGIKDKELVIVALLHDAVEDQAIKLAKDELEAKYGAESVNDTEFLAQKQDEIREIAFAEIKKLYGEKVVFILRKLTNSDFNSIAKAEVDPANKEAFAKKKNELYKEHVREAIIDADTLVVKLADFMHNTSDASLLAESPIKSKFRNKYVPVFEVFIERLRREDLPCPIVDKESAIMKLNNIVKELSQ